MKFNAIYMKSRDIILAYTMPQAQFICNQHNLNIHNTIIFLHQGLSSVTHKLNYERKFVPVENPEFMKLLHRLKGYEGLFTFYFENHITYTYCSESLWYDIYLVFSLNPLMDLTKYDKPIQELYKLIRKDCE